jgi:hypothetical protein
MHTDASILSCRCDDLHEDSEWGIPASKRELRVLDPPVHYFGGVSPLEATKNSSPLG